MGSVPCDTTTKIMASSNQSLRVGTNNPNHDEEGVDIEIEKKKNNDTYDGTSRGSAEGGGEEAVDWVVEGEEEEDARIELGLVGKVWTKRTINVKAFMNTMQQVWQPLHGVDISSIGANTFTFQFHHWRDKNRVVEGQPWHFDKHAIIFDDIQGNLKPSEMNLFALPMWVRVYNLPFKGRLNLNNVEALGKKLGEFVKMDSSGSLGIDKSIRLRIKIDVRKPLIQRVKVKLRGGEEDFYEVKYERPPLFCYHCGLLGHGVKDCDGCREEDDPTIHFGDWMKASPWKRNLATNTQKDGREKGGCAKNLFITKPKTQISLGMNKQMKEVAGILEEALTLAGSSKQMEEGKSKSDEPGNIENGESQEQVSEQLAQVPGAISGSLEEETREGTSHGDKKGWKRVPREGGSMKERKKNMTGNRRKERVEGTQEGEHEGETCGIKKKIGLDASLVEVTVDNSRIDGVAGPTSWTLGGQ